MVFQGEARSVTSLLEAARTAPEHTLRKQYGGSIPRPTTPPPAVAYWLVAMAWRNAGASEFCRPLTTAPRPCVVDA
jgi:hypothetical protein